MTTLKKLLSKGCTQFHLVAECKKLLLENGYTEVSPKDNLECLNEGRYFISPFSSMLIPFILPKNTQSVRLVCAHTDFPMLKLKTRPNVSKKGYLSANVEPYGGLIKESWFDRPLGLAGKIVTLGQNAFSPCVRLFDSKKPLFIIPSLAPHLKRGGKSEDIDIQKEMLPLYAMASDIEDTTEYNDVLIEYISRELSVERNEILDYDLYLYIYDNISNVGLTDNYLVSARIDNISSVAAIMEAFINCKQSDKMIIGALFDNEEIGSRSKQGADSILLKDIASRIVPDRKLMYDAFNISIDVAHATHPNYPEKSDITNDILLGNGIVLKSSASQRYATDSEAGAVIEALSREKNIKIQRQVNRSGMAGGQTLGPIISSYLPVKSVDMGLPILAMHSAGELMHERDYRELVKLLIAYFEY